MVFLFVFQAFDKWCQIVHKCRHLVSRSNSASSLSKNKMSNITSSHVSSIPTISSGFLHKLQNKCVFNPTQHGWPWCVTQLEVMDVWQSGRHHGIYFEWAWSWAFWGVNWEKNADKMVKVVGITTHIRRYFIKSKEISSVVKAVEA